MKWAVLDDFGFYMKPRRQHDAPEVQTFSNFSTALSFAEERGRGTVVEIVPRAVVRSTVTRTVTINPCLEAS